MYLPSRTEVIASDSRAMVWNPASNGWKSDFQTLGCRGYTICKFMQQNTEMKRECADIDICSDPKNKKIKNPLRGSDLYCDIPRGSRTRSYPEDGSTDDLIQSANICAAVEHTHVADTLPSRSGLPTTAGEICNS